MVFFFAELAGTRLGAGLEYCYVYLTCAQVILLQNGVKLAPAKFTALWHLGIKFTVLWHLVY